MLKLEMYKILKRKLVWIILAFIFGLVAVYDGFFIVNNYCLGGSEIGRRNDYELEQYEAAKGILTEEKLEDFYKKYKQNTFEDGRIWDEGNVFDENGNLMRADEIFPLSEYDFDIRFGYFKNWGWFLSSNIQERMKYLYAFVIVVFSALFTYEKECGMQEILLSTKNGRRTCTMAKVGAAFLITNGVCFFLFIIYTLELLCITKGMIGWDTSIQMITWLRNATYNMNNLGLMLHTFFLSLLAMNVALLITLTASFLAKNPVAAMCVSLAVLFLLHPDTLALDVHLDNMTVNHITSLLPMSVLEVQNLLEQVPLNISGHKLQFLTIAEVLYSLLLLVGGVMFFRLLPKNQKYYAS